MNMIMIDNNSQWLLINVMRFALHPDMDFVHCEAMISNSVKLLFFA